MEPPQKNAQTQYMVGENEEKRAITIDLSLEIVRQQIHKVRTHRYNGNMPNQINKKLFINYFLKTKYFNNKSQLIRYLRVHLNQLVYVYYSCRLSWKQEYMAKKKDRTWDLVANTMQCRKKQFINDKSLRECDVVRTQSPDFLVSSLHRSQKAPCRVHLQSSKTRRRKLGLRL